MVLGVYTNGQSASTAALAQVLSMMPWSQSMRHTRAPVFKVPVLSSLISSGVIWQMGSGGMAFGGGVTGGGGDYQTYTRTDTSLPPVQPLLYGMLSWYMYIYTHTYYSTMCVCVCVFITAVPITSVCVCVCVCVCARARRWSSASLWSLRQSGGVRSARDGGKCGNGVSYAQPRRRRGWRRGVPVKSVMI